MNLKVNARFLLDRRIPAGSWDAAAVGKRLNEALAKDYANVGDLVKTVMNYQVFFNRDVINERACARGCKNKNGQRL